ncbi:NRDE protein-domain-containing protein [Thamnidium elegans]|nr:NRDE protein-domain-containing protein [Thamnidium elegans]
MCILFWTVDNHPKYRFVFAANRDEFLQRPTSRAKFWDPPHDNILAGTDLEQNIFGTWLGITKEGRFAALTNFRETNFQGEVSRGVLVRDFLWSSETVHTAVQHVKDQQTSFGGFSLVCFDFAKQPTEMEYYTNRENQPITELEPGIVYGLSNSVLTMPWPKVKQGQEILKDILSKYDGEDEEEMTEALFDLLGTSKPMNDPTHLPQVLTDLSERICIPKFDFPIKTIKQPTYATKTSTVVLIDHNNRVTFIERDWYNEDMSLATPGEYKDVVHHFDLK